MNTDPRTRRHSGFTLVELLVVVVIVVIISAVTLPAVLPALANRQVSEGARILQAALAGARDSAIRFNAPRGVRLIPDQMSNQVSPLSGTTVGQMFTYNRMVAIEPAPDISDGYVTFPSVPIFPYPVAGPTGSPGALWGGSLSNNPPSYPFPFPGNPAYGTLNNSTVKNNAYYPANPPYTVPSAVGPRVLVVEQSFFVDNIPALGPNPPTNWFWNVRIGDRFRFADSGRYYTVVGPMTTPNPEFFVNDGPPGTSTLVETYYDASGTTYNPHPDFLFLVNGVDDDGDGFIDNQVDGVDQNMNYPSTAAPQVVPDDAGEWLEHEQWLGAQASQATNHASPPGYTTLQVPPQLNYTIARRPVPVGSAAEVSLPAGVVIDATTWDTTRERSRIPVDMTTGYVDIMLNQSGQVIPTTTYSSPASATMDASFYHFWIADRGDVYAPSTPPSGVVLQLPVPQGTPGWPGPLYLKKDRHLVTLFTRTGNILTNSIENFDPTNAAGGGNYPFLNAELGIREAK